MESVRNAQWLIEMIGMFGLSNEEAGELRCALDTLAHRSPELFYKLFWRGAEVPWNSILTPFARVGLLQEHGTSVRAAVQVWRGDGLIIVTDRPDNPRLDRVFPIFSDESLFLARCAFRNEGRRVLDIGTGSGILAIAGASVGREVVAGDINVRALQTARLNAALNGVTSHVHLVEGDSAESFAGPFDLIVANPPFVPTPETNLFHTAGDGGPDGTRIIRRILCRAPQLLSETGVLVMNALSLVRDGRLLVEDLAAAALPAGYTVRMIPIYADSVTLGEFCEVFARWDPARLWRSGLSRQGFDRVAYVVLVIGRYTAKHMERPSDPDKTRFSGGWAQRFARYRYWLDRTAL
jgi:HemK-related putative methylase